MENKKDSRALKWIYARTAGHRGKLILLMLCDAFVSAAAVLFAVLSKSFLDKALHGASGAWETAAVMAAVLVAQVLIRIYSGMLSERIDGSLNMSLKNHVFGELMKKKYGDVSRYHSGELLNRMFSDTEVVCSGITDIVPNAVSIGTRLIAAFAALAILSYHFGLCQNIDKVIIGDIMPLIPGLSTVNAVRDIAAGDYLSGAVRIIDAVVITVGIAVGVGTSIIIFTSLGVI